MQNQGVWVIDGKALSSLSGSGDVRIGSDGYMYIYNSDTAKWHKVNIRGAADRVVLGIEQTGVETIP
jgi:hypothetical protein